MFVVLAIVEMLERLEEMDERLQAEAKGILTRFFAFLNEPTRDCRRGRQLRLRLQRNASGRIVRIAWTRRIGHLIRKRNGRQIWGTRILRGAFRRAWVVTIARDIESWDGFREFERQRAAWARAHGRVRRALSDLRMWLENRWAPHASEEARVRATAILASHRLPARDARPLAGAIALGEDLLTREGPVHEAVMRWWRAYDGSEDVAFEPCVSKDVGRLAVLGWRWKGIIWTQGRLVPVGGRIATPTVRWMRRIHVPPVLHSALSAAVRGLARLARKYDEVANELRHHRAAGRAALRGRDLPGRNASGRYVAARRFSHHAAACDGAVDGRGSKPFPMRILGDNL